MLFSKKKTVLLVDDDENIRLTAEAILENWGLQVLTSESGREALEITKANKIDLVLLDVNMPDISGFEICKILKGNPQTSKIAVILLTGLGKTKDVDTGFQCGANDYLIKPVDWDRVKSKISKLLRIQL
jgi:DNA-binding response OmpR family regulator